jgi:hypothetical protein
MPALKEDDEKLNGSDSQDIVIVETDPALNAGAGADDDKDDEDRRTKNADDDRDGDDESASGTDAEREAIRERRRLEKLERKERRDKAISRDKLELDFLRKRNDELERRMSTQEQRAHQADLSGLDAQLRTATQEAEMAERVIAKAVEAGNGADVTQALRYRDQAFAKVNQLTAAKQQALTKRPEPAAQGLDDRTLMHAQEFLSENKWYDPQGRDEDSAIVLAIDQGLARDGYAPNTEEYWDELRARAARRLPERFKPAAPAREERSPRGGPSVGSGREHAPTSTRQEVYLSPERKQALIDAGVWDDPALRMKYAKRYAEYDRLARGKNG